MSTLDKPELNLDSSQEKALSLIRAWWQRLRTEWDARGPVSCSGACPQFPHTHGRLQDTAPLALGGLAGTGKTTLIRQLPGLLGARVAYVTPTHKAAAVLRSKLPEDQGDNVRTLHSLIYLAQPLARCQVTRQLMRELPRRCECRRRDDCECPRQFAPCPLGDTHTCRAVEELRFERRDALGGLRDLIVADEASMLSDEEIRDICHFRVPTLLVGDHGQLPPVKKPMNARMRQPDVTLEVNHRQGEASGIIPAALFVRSGGQLTPGLYGDGSVVVLHGSDPRLRELLTPLRFPPGPQHAILAWTNRVRAAVNHAFHGGGPPRPGDRVVLLQRARVFPMVLETGVWRPADGEPLWLFSNTLGSVVHAKRPSGTTIELIVELDPEFRRRNVRLIRTRAVLRQFGSESALPLNERVPGTHLWDYAYCLTAHKAQGSEFSRVIIIDERPSDYSRWMYTAITRARDKLVIIQDLPALAETLSRPVPG